MMLVAESGICSGQPQLWKWAIASAAHLPVSPGGTCRAINLVLTVQSLHKELLRQDMKSKWILPGSGVSDPGNLFPASSGSKYWEVSEV